MATFTWVAPGDTGDWNATTSWTSTSSGVPGLGDTALFTDEAGGGHAYQANVTASTTENAAVALFNTKGSSHEATLNVAGTLTVGTLEYDSTAAGLVVVDSGGVFDVTTTINDPRSRIITVQISGNEAVGGKLELGGLTIGSGPTVPADFEFQNAIAAPSTGVIDFTSGFVNNSITNTTSQFVGDASGGGFDWGDSFVFKGATFTPGSVSYIPGTQTLTVSTTAGGSLTMHNVFSTASTFEIINGDTIEAVCYARGTMIRTPDGELPVEKLRAGKQVITLVDGQEVLQTVKWLGHRRIEFARHRKPETAAPIRILQGAFADNMPHRDLVVSPDHAIFVDGKLICARQLVNGTTIRQELNWTAVDYYHVQLDSHAILLAEGLPAESYIDTGNSGFFANSGEPLVLHPDLTDESDYPTREAGSCAPFVWDEASVQPVWQRLAERAAVLGRPVPPRKTTTDPGLRLLFEGRSIKPVYGDDRLVIFTVPRGARQVRLVSRAQSPTEARPWLEDRRRLGVRVARIVLRNAQDMREVPVDHPDIAKGWWAIERDGQAICRWTDGEAVLPLPKMGPDVLLEIHLAGEMIYAASAEPERHAA